MMMKYINCLPKRVGYEEIAGYISKPVETDTLLKIIQLKLEEH
jgi:hypothetical protein